MYWKRSTAPRARRDGDVLSHPQRTRIGPMLALLVLGLTALVAVPPARSQATPPQPAAPTIVGGREAEPGAWPWQVALVQGAGTPYAGQFCGGSLIDPLWVVTAAHCVAGAAPGDFEVVAGIHDLKLPTPGALRLDVAEIIVHPAYNLARPYDSDIALLELAAPAVFRPPGAGQLPIAGIEPDATGRSWAGVIATVTGWGNRSSTGIDYPATLHEVEVPIMAQTACAANYPFSLTDNMLCAGLPDGGQDACQGDSGGPLVVYDDQRDRWRLAGIVSWGIGCAEPGQPGVYTRVSRFSRWVSDESGVDFAPDFTVDVTPGSSAVCAGVPVQVAVRVGGQYGFAQPVALSLAGLPPGGSAQFAPAQLTPPGTSQLTIATSGVPVGAHELQVRGQAAALAYHASFRLTITGTVPTAPQLLQPAAGAGHTSATPALSWTVVPGAESYLLQVATDTAFAHIIYTATLDETSHVLPDRLALQTRYYWRVQAQSDCGASGFTAVHSFTTGWPYCRVVDWAIPNEDLAGLQDSLNLNVGGVVTDVDVFLTIDHAWIGEVMASLAHNIEETSAGEALLFGPNVCGYERDLVATFNDEAAHSAGGQCWPTPPAIRGDVRPQELLAGFDSQPLAGAWQLTVADVSHGGQGRLVEWCLMPALAAPYCNAVTDIPAAECAALESLYAATRGWDWASSDGWLNGAQACEWAGVVCWDGHVTGLTLAGNNLDGGLPAAIGELTHLQEIDVSGNGALAGPLPGSMTGLSLARFWYDDTALCAPTDVIFTAWLRAIDDLRATGNRCGRQFLPVTRR